MSEELSDRARAILEAAERLAAPSPQAAPSAARFPTAGSAPTPSAAPFPAAGPTVPPTPALAPPPRPLPQAPRSDWSLPAPPHDAIPLPATAPGQLLAIVDQIVHAAEGARRRLEQLSQTLDELTRRVDAAGRAAPPPPPTETPPPAPAPAEPAASQTPLRARPLPPPTSTTPPTPAATPEPESQAAAARLLAVELAVAGGTRMEVDAHLRERFGLRDTRVLLDEVFGEGSAPGARLPWGGAPEAGR